MSTFNSYQLTHPELLSERQLCQILKNHFIETSHLDKLCKATLVELYRKVALPLPQRQPRNSKNEDEKNSTTNNSQTETDNWKSDTHDSCSSSTSIKEDKPNYEKQLGRLKPPIQENKVISKKICLALSPKTELQCNGFTKRKNVDINQDSNSLMRKRQKITWP